LLFLPKRLTISVPKPGEEIGGQSELSINISENFPDWDQKLDFFLCRSDPSRRWSNAASSMILRPAAHTKHDCLKLFECLTIGHLIHSRWASARLFLCLLIRKTPKIRALNLFEVQWSNISDRSLIAVCASKLWASLSSFEKLKGEGLLYKSELGQPMRKHQTSRKHPKLYSTVSFQSGYDPNSATWMFQPCSRHRPASWQFKSECGNDDLIVHLLLIHVSSLSPVVQVFRNETTHIFASPNNPKVTLVHCFWAIGICSNVIFWFSLNRVSRWSVRNAEKSRLPCQCFRHKFFKYTPGNHSGVVFDISVKFSIKHDHFPPISNLHSV
jgi:hypothetical protein